jgi:hypothetical protein
MSASPPDARCANHADAKAIFACERCGSFACEACAGPGGVRQLCRRCHQIFVKSPPSPRAKLSLFLATAGFIGFVPGVVGLILARRELAAIERMEAPITGEDSARMARSLGWFHVFMLLLVAAGAVYRFAN